MRRVYLFGDICNERAEKFIAQLHDLFEEGGEPVTIFINSSGGSVTDALAIYDVIQHAPCEIFTIGLGKVHSAAVTVMLAAPRENRACYPNTEFMSHDISWKSDGPRAFLKGRVDQLERTVAQLLAVYTRDTNLTAEEARERFFTDLDDHYFTAQEALDMGFISRIITRESSQPGIASRADLRLVEPISVSDDERIVAVNSSQE
ncbi:MAG TPA: ATP-dependent Clp protease proteolytic subunit [Blastocatellia bacterium]|nr:ATP-dependent Clp protease proteolytic subunit [Blastocatellia bacterium]